MRKTITAALLAMAQVGAAQNVGIGTNTPTGPLTFASTLGNKIVLWGDGNTSHYGIGVQSTYLQLYADVASSNIVFGYGRSGAFTERARIYNTGLEGMYLNGRLHLRNGDPANAGGGGGAWLYKPDNTAIIGFMGAQNDRNIGFYGGPAQWGFTYDVTNGRVGIGNNLPNAPLAFGATGGKKITLYPGTTGDVGFAVASNRLQIYSDNPNADVAIGYDAAGVFNERFAFKPNGALALMGATGAVGQVLTSNGSGAATSWAGPGSLMPWYATSGGAALSNNNLINVPAATINFTSAQTIRGILFIGTYTVSPCVVGPCNSAWTLKVFLDGTELKSYSVQATALPGQYSHEYTVGPYAFETGAGTHSITFTLQNKVLNPTVAITPFLLTLPM